MTGKNIQLTVFTILAAACIVGSVYLFWFYGQFNFWLFLGAWIFGVIGVLTYYSEKSDDEDFDPYAHDHEHHHGHGHDVAHQ